MDGSLIESSVLIALVGAIAGIISGAITYLTTVRTAEKTTTKEVTLKQLETTNAIDLSKLKQEHEISFSQQTFVREIIQATLEHGGPDDQIRNLRAYARIGLIGEPYAERILALEEEELPSVSTFERILSDPSIDLSIAYFERLLEVSRAVGLIREMPTTRGARPLGTGFVVGDGLVLTADHVVSSAKEAAKISLVMNFETDSDGGNKQTSEFVLDPQHLFITMKDVGFSLIAASPRSANGDDISGYGRILGSELDTCTGERINLIHHPEGERKRVAVREGRVVSVDDRFLYYYAPSRAGSSGAPVLNDDFKILAVHYAYARQSDDPSRRLMQGVPWLRILARLRREADGRTSEEATLLSTIWQ